jgi:glycosyltransferase involved in cell wall biosynthesis
VEDKAYIFPKGNVDELAKCLQNLCDDGTAVKKMKESAAFVCGKYNWDDVTNRTLELYQ